MGSPTLPASQITSRGNNISDKFGPPGFGDIGRRRATNRILMQSLVVDVQGEK